MPIVTPTDFVEGEVITKASILDTRTAIEEIDFDIDGDNIREEGLDRRVFEDLSLVSNPYDSVRLASYQDLPRSTAWRAAVCSDGSLVNSFAPHWPQINIPWDPELDSYVIVRCSFLFISPDPKSGESLWSEDAFDFGLYVIPPNATPLSSPALAYNTSGAGIWPYSRTYLNEAFSRYAEDAGTGFKGQHDEWGFDQRSRMMQSVTLLYMAKSNSSERFASFIWSESGTAEVVLMYRSRIADSDYRTDGVRINGLQLSYQKFRR